MVQVFQKKRFNLFHRKAIVDDMHKQFVDEIFQVLSIDGHDAWIFREIFEYAGRLMNISRFGYAYVERVPDMIVEHQNANFEFLAFDRV